MIGLGSETALAQTQIKQQPDITLQVGETRDIRFDSLFSGASSYNGFKVTSGIVTTENLDTNGQAATSASAIVTFRITAVAMGMTSVVMTTTGGNPNINQTFQVTVVPNPPPTPVGSIASLTLSAGGAAGSRDVSGFFSDTDVLMYSAVSADMAMATGSTIAVTPVAVGSTIITVTATDLASQAVTQTFTITVNLAAPTISASVSTLTATAGRPSRQSLSPQQGVRWTATASVQLLAMVWRLTLRLVLFLAAPQRWQKQ